MDNCHNRNIKCSSVSELNTLIEKFNRKYKFIKIIFSENTIGIEIQENFETASFIGRQE